ncbi:precorrin-6A/cobalt-precorrin-6A reductase, partial [[Clostridium] clostridioforme]|nr:precorrin-6A/cobalt-precorrin-6A reductase [Enterocloster clostridioformis]
SRPGAGVVHMPDVGVVHMPDVETAVTWLSSVTGNILVTTGSKELSSYTRIRDYEQRIYARVLPSEEAVARCRSLGFEGRHIIAMQGPFSEEMNLAQLREYGCAYLVTKDGGAAGGFSEKIKAARRAGAAAVVIDRPGSGEGISLDEIKVQLKEWMDHEKKGSIYG